MRGPLEGVRVLDLTTVVSGPAAAVMLADQGADVIKIETLAGDNTRRSRAGAFPPMFISCNRGKRSVAVDLKKQEGAEILWRLIETADVLIQNFRPGTTERLGFGADDVLMRNPKLVYMSISGVGEVGPYASKRVYDPLIQGLSGMADIQADPVSGRPRMTRTIIADKATATYAAQAITAALFRRERTGKGQHIRLSMLDTMLSYLWPEGMAPFTIVSDGTTEHRNTPHDMIFEAADGYLTVGTNSDKEWRGLCAALERPQWLDDPRFTTQALRNENRQPRLLLLDETFRTNTVAHWLAALDKGDVPCAPVLSRGAVPDHPQVIASGTVETFEHPGVGEVRQARPAARFEESPAAIQGPAPYLGQHSAEVLMELGYDAAAIADFAASDIIKCHPQS
ncbi:MAG: crotonobetainyl-CoA:carnitine CoA-transferase CaiB-like acyl-CoA transferase [Hyphomicrobiaceae bacterium]|jgi:crotonobetainyl-CoA:carnitine CoA-transferase CaiB-like acyl-CoA transferase